MTLAPFEYTAPADLAGALEALARPGAVAMAGGHHLLTRLKRREQVVGTVVDLRDVAELRGVERGPLGTVRIGAGTTLTDLLAEHLLDPPDLTGSSRDLRHALGEALAGTGDRQSRNRVTLGGQLASGRPGNDVATALVAHAARATLAGPDGTRTLPVRDLWTAGGAWAPARTELIVSVEIDPDAVGSAHARWADRATLEAICAVSVVLCRRDDGALTCRAAAAGLVARPVLITTGEEPVPEAGAPAWNLDVAPGTALDDYLASADYRRFMVQVLAGRALTAAVRRAGGAG